MYGLPSTENSTSANNRPLMWRNTLSPGLRFTGSRAAWLPEWRCACGHSLAPRRNNRTNRNCAPTNSCEFLARPLRGSIVHGCTRHASIPRALLTERKRAAGDPLAERRACAIHHAADSCRADSDAMHESTVPCEPRVARIKEQGEPALSPQDDDAAPRFVLDLHAYFSDVSSASCAVRLHCSQPVSTATRRGYRRSSWWEHGRRSRRHAQAEAEVAGRATNPTRAFVLRGRRHCLLHAAVSPSRRGLAVERAPHPTATPIAHTESRSRSAAISGMMEMCTTSWFQTMKATGSQTDDLHYKPSALAR